MRGIVFDFDGVILESAEIKTRAFRRVFESYPEHLERIVKFHLDNVGVSRFEKFETIYRDYLGRTPDEKELQKLSQSFAQFVYEEILACPFVHGAYQFLKKYSKKYHLLIASGTPEAEVKDIVTQRGLNEFFREVYGSPRSKGEILRDIISRNTFHQREVVFIGDAMSDYLAAQEASVPFVGRVPKEGPNPFPADGVIGIVEDLDQLDRQWELLTGDYSL